MTVVPGPVRTHLRRWGVAQREPGPPIGPGTSGPLPDQGEVRDVLPRAVRALATWCGDLGRAERLVGEALDRAAALPPGERPSDLTDWCVTLGRQVHLDALRRAPRPDERLEAPMAELSEAGDELDPDGVPSGLDDRLALLFVVCDPALPEDLRLVLALRVVGGLPLPEVAVHLGLGEAATRTRLARAEVALAEAQPRFAVPPAAEREARLPLVLDCVAAMYAVAHRTSPEPPDALEDLGGQALSIADGLVDMHPGDPEVRGLRSMVLLGLARRPGRVDEHGVALALDEVDRRRWDRRMTAVGLDDAAVAMQGHGRFALEAAIAALHAASPSVAQTDWPRVVQLYGVLRDLGGSPAVEVAELAARTQLVVHAFPGTEVEAPQVLATIERRLVELVGDAPTFARRDAAFALADLRWRTGRRGETVSTYRRLLEHVTSPPVRAFCERRIALAGAGVAAGPG